MINVSMHSVPSSGSDPPPTGLEGRTHQSVAPFSLFRHLLSSSHLPKVLIRKSAIRARSGASTLKDQYLGQVPGGKSQGETLAPLGTDLDEVQQS